MKETENKRKLSRQQLLYWVRYWKEEAIEARKEIERLRCLFSRWHFPTDTDYYYPPKHTRVYVYYKDELYDGVYLFNNQWCIFGVNGYNLTTTKITAWIEVKNLKPIKQEEIENGRKRCKRIRRTSTESLE